MCVCAFVPPCPSLGRGHRHSRTHLKCESPDGRMEEEDEEEKKRWRRDVEKGGGVREEK